MKLLTNIISFFFKSEEDQRRLYKVVIPSFIIHFFAGILLAILTFVIPRGLGSRQYGIYAYSYSIIYIIVSLATYGLCILAIRESSSLLSKNQKGLWKGLHKWSVKLILLICVAFAAIVAIFITVSTFYTHLLKETPYTIPLLLALVTVPFYGLMNYYSGALRGQHKVVLSLLPDNIVKPVFFLLTIGTVFVLSGTLDVQKAIFANIVAFALAALFSIILFYKTTELKTINPEYDTKSWKKALKSFFLLTVILSINSKMDILMLGYLKDSSQVGIYDAADRIAASVMVFLMIMNQVSAASISRLHSLGQKQKLQEMITKTSRWVFIISLPLYAIIILFRKWIMSYFGVDFIGGETALVIIASGQIINLAYGPVGNFALMTGNQKFNIIFVAINIFINISLNLILTPTMGITGTAIATTCALITWNTGMFFAVRKKTGINTWIFG
jgi:O-antigen/teichoic acid export membrane protein